MSFPRVKAPLPTVASPTHRLISEGLRRKFTENKKDFIVVDEESGLDSEILPMDITIKEGSGNKIIAFIEIDGADHFITREDGQRVSHRRDQLREELYKFNRPRIPLLRIDLLDNRPKERCVEELYEKITTKS
jgi:endo-alpha-1,4-polygalactosaminidase (GH114 family)